MSGVLDLSFSIEGGVVIAKDENGNDRIEGMASRDGERLIIEFTPEAEEKYSLEAGNKDFNIKLNFVNEEEEFTVESVKLKGQKFGIDVGEDKVGVWTPFVSGSVETTDEGVKTSSKISVPISSGVKINLGYKGEILENKIEDHLIKQDTYRYSGGVEFSPSKKFIGIKIGAKVVIHSEDTISIIDQKSGEEVFRFEADDNILSWDTARAFGLTKADLKDYKEQFEQAQITVQSAKDSFYRMQEGYIDYMDRLGLPAADYPKFAHAELAVIGSSISAAQHDLDQLTVRYLNKIQESMEAQSESALQQSQVIGAVREQFVNGQASVDSEALDDLLQAYDQHYQQGNNGLSPDPRGFGYHIPAEYGAMRIGEFVLRDLGVNEVLWHSEVREFSQALGQQLIEAWNQGRDTDKVIETYLIEELKDSSDFKIKQNAAILDFMRHHDLSENELLTDKLSHEFVKFYVDKNDPLVDQTGFDAVAEQILADNIKLIKGIVLPTTRSGYGEEFSNQRSDEISGAEQLNTRTYTIQTGDTLSSLAEKLGLSVDELWAVNPQITDPNKIYAGDELNLPFLDLDASSVSQIIREEFPELQLVQATAALGEVGGQDFISTIIEERFAGLSGAELEAELTVFRADIASLGDDLSVTLSQDQIAVILHGRDHIDIQDGESGLNTYTTDEHGNIHFHNGLTGEDQVHVRETGEVLSADEYALRQAIEDGSAVYKNDDYGNRVYQDETGTEVYVSGATGNYLSPKEYQHEVDYAKTTADLTAGVQLSGGYSGFNNFGSGLFNGGMSEGQMLGSLLDGALGVNDYLSHVDKDRSLFDEAPETQLRAASSVVDLYNLINNGDANDLEVAQSVLGTINSLDNAYFDDGLSNTGVNRASSVISFANAIDGGNGLDILDSGFNTLEAFDVNFGLEDSQFGGVGAAIGLANALESGNTVGALQSGLQLSSALGYNVPVVGAYAGYIGAAAQLMDGNVEGAAMSAASTYLMTLGPYGIAAGIALQVLGGSLFSSPPPQAWAKFELNADGSVDFNLDSNSGGSGMKEQVGGIAGQIVDAWYNLRDNHGVDLTPKNFPVIGMEASDYYAETRLQSNPNSWVKQTIYSSDPYAAYKIQQAGINAIVFGWMHDNGMTSFSLNPYHGDTDWSASTRGTGIFAGGGQVYIPPVHVNSSQITSIATPRMIPAQELQNVGQTWGIRGDLFRGEQGALLALGLGAGLTSYEAYAELTLPRQETPVSVLDHDEYASLIPDEYTSVIGAGTGIVGELNTFEPLRPIDTYSESYAPGYGNNPGDGGGGRGGGGGLIAPVFDSAGVTDQSAIVARNTAPGLLIDDDDDLPLTLAEAAVLAEEAVVRAMQTVTGDTNEAPDDDDMPNDGTGDEETSADYTTVEDQQLFVAVSDLPGMAAVSFSAEASLRTFSADTTLESDTTETTADSNPYQISGSSEHGVIRIAEDGMIQFTPHQDYFGFTEVTLNYVDLEGTPRSHTLIIEVEAANDNPDAVDDGEILLSEDSVFNLSSLMDNDGDIDNAHAELVMLEPAPHSAGTFHQNTEGDWLFTPHDNVVGAVDLSYRIMDPDGGISVASVRLNYQPVADAPMALDDELFGAVEETEFRFNALDLLANDSNPDGDTPLSITGVRLADASHGSVTFDADSGEIVLTPADNVQGALSLIYDVSNGSHSTTGRAVIHVENTPDDFSGVDRAFTIQEDAVTVWSPSVFLTDVVSVDNPNVSISAVRMVDGNAGQVSLTPEGVRFVPARDFVGETAFEVRLDNGFERISVTAAIEVVAVNDAVTVADDDLGVAVQDQPHVFMIDDLIANDMDAEGDDFSVTAIDVLTTDGDVAAATLDWDQATGAVTVTPLDGFSGDLALRYTVTETDSGRESTANARLVFDRSIDGWGARGHADLNATEDETVLFTPQALMSLTGGADYSDVVFLQARVTEGEGALTILGDESVRLVPGEDFNGPLSFELDVTDGLRVETVTVSVNVAPMADAPETEDEVYDDGVEDTVYTLNAADLLANDIDADGDSLSMASIRLADDTQGDVVFDVDSGTITVTPAEHFNGDLALIYAVSDGEQVTEARTTITFTAVNDTAAQSDKAFETDRNETRIFTRSALLDHLEDVDGETISIDNLSLSDEDAGVLTLLDSGDVLFIPAEDYEGEVTFTFDAVDGAEREATDELSAITPTPVTVTVNVLEINDAPEAIDDVFDGAVEDQVYTLNAADLLANDTDIDSEAASLSVTAVRLADETQGEVIFDAETGTITVTPAADFNGDLSLVYDLSDGDLSSEGRATITFAAENDTATQSDKAFDTDRNEMRLFTREALLDHLTDVDGENITIDNVRLSDDAAGVITMLDNGNVQFMPAEDFAGEVAFTFDAVDGSEAAPVPVTVNLNVMEINDAPEIGADIFDDAVEDQAYTFNVSDLLANDHDAEGAALRITAIDVVDSNTGSVSWDKDTGEVVFTPAENYFGEARLTYTAEEVVAESNADDTVAETIAPLSSQGQVTVVFKPEDDTAELSNRSYRGTQPYDQFNLLEAEDKLFTRESLLDVLVDVDGETLLISAVSVDADHGEAIVTENGNVFFRPQADMTGEVILTLDVTDGVTTQQIETKLRIWPVNDGPTVSEDRMTVAEDGELSVAASDLLMNDHDVEGDDFRVTGIWGTSDNLGRAYYDTDSETLRYVPAENQSGPAWVDYIVEDSNGEFSVSRLHVTITADDDPIQAHDDTLSGLEDEALMISLEQLTANDDNPDNETLHLVAVDGSTLTDGAVSIEDGQVRFVPAAGFSGRQQFAYTIEDESGHQSTAIATVVVESINDAPVVSLMQASSIEDEAVSFTVAELLENATDEEGDWMQVVGARSQYGDVVFDHDQGIVNFKPIDNFNSALYDSPAVIEYLVVDEQGAETWGQVALDVAAVNDPPEAVGDLVFAWAKGPNDYQNPILGDWLTANDIERDGEAVWVSEVTSAFNGSLALQTSPDNSGPNHGEGGLIHYQANEGFVGRDVFRYTVTDGQTNTDGSASEDSGTVIVNVIENNAVQTQDFATIVAEDTQLRYTIDDLMPYIYDEDLNQTTLPERHRIVAVGDNENGSVQLAPDGSIIFTPTQDYNSVQHAERDGPLASFSFTVEDIVGHQSTSTAYITYTPVNDAPVAVTDSIANGVIKEDVEARIRIADIMNNDYDVDWDDPSFVQVLGANNGSVRVEGGEIVYQSNANYNGAEVIRYQIRDPEGLTDTGEIRFNVQPVNDDPRVEYDTNKGDDSGWNKYSIAGLLRNDSDIDGDSLSISNARVVSGGGSVRINGGNLEYRGDAGSNDRIIEYNVNDGNGGTTVSRLTLTEIEAINRPPTNFALFQYHYSHVAFGAQDPDTDLGLLTYQLLDFRVENGSSSEIYHDRPHDWTNEYDRIKFTTGGLVDGESVLIFTIGVSDGENFREFTRRVVYDANIPDGGRNYGYPIVFDLNNDGLNLVNAEAGARYDWGSDGDLDRTGWIAGQGDGILFYDHNQDGQVTLENEIAFVDYLEGANTDLEGLRAFDSNADGVFDARDDEWDQFGVWIDDGDGESEDGEMTSLVTLGIESINLTSDEERYDDNGNIVFGEGMFTYADGSTGMFGDVAFGYEENTDDAAVNSQNQDTEEDQATVVAAVEETKTSDTVETAASSDAEPNNAVDSDQAEPLASSTPELNSDASDAVNAVEAFDDLDDLDDEMVDMSVARATQSLAAQAPKETVALSSDDPDAIPSANPTTDDDDSMVG